MRSFQRDNEMKSAMLTDPKVREHITRHFFRRARRLANEDKDAASRAGTLMERLPR